MNPLQSYRICNGEVHGLIAALNEPSYGLGARGNPPYFDVLDNSGQTLAHVVSRGNTLHVDSSPARSASPEHMEAIFWQRFWGVLYTYCNTTLA